MKNLLVATNTPFNNSLLTYSSKEEYRPGESVTVPLGKRLVNGWIVETQKDSDEPSAKELREINEKNDACLNLSHHEMQLFKWMAEYYHYPLGQLINDVLPKAMKRPRPSQLIDEVDKLELESLTSGQEEVFKKISAKLMTGFSRHLVHGVTGSGKTHIYLHLMKQVLEQGKSVLFLLPEINLTPQFLNKFKAVLPCPVSVYSSEVSASDKYLLRQNFKTQNLSQVILGVRSSVFLPIENLGLIIVDEEHDSSFKQDDRCTYNARDIAIKRASMLGLPVVLGSATPSLESYCASIDGENYSALKERVHGYKMPVIKIIDQRKDKSEVSSNEHWPLTRPTIEAIHQAKARGEQALVFINRLGFSSYIQCSSCGHQFQCLNCSTNMRYFKQRSELACQTCGNKMPMPKMCPECSCLTLTQKGYGTEKIEEVLSATIPELRVERFDRDEIKTMQQLKDCLDRFHRHETDVLVGTQMLSKGHNFKKVNTVIVLGIDQQLNFPDFRAMERAWQTLVQVSGRSGRFGSASEVLVQTHTPEHPLFTHVINHHFDDFYREELDLRQRAECPPIAKMAAIYLTHKDKNFLIKESMHFGSWLEGLKEHHFEDVDILGPRPAIMEKRVNKFTWCVLLRSNDLNHLHSVVNAGQKYLAKIKGLHVKIDVDPQIIS